MTTLDILRKLPRPRSERDAWSHGVDCALNGATTENCHFSIFSTPERTRQWEAGKKAAEEFLSSNGRFREADGWPKRGSKVVWKGERITIDDVWQSRFGDWKISYSDDFGGGGIISLKYFKANNQLSGEETSPD